VPDDALGNSDPARLERLGAVLGMAGRQVQVIVLTCTPDRYRNVGSAEVIRLAEVEGGIEGEAPGLSPGPPVGEAGSWSARVVECLRAAGTPLGRAEVISRSGLPGGLWQATIASLVAAGRVVREGEKRGARYRLPGG
jgi:hypothetical protein